MATDRNAATAAAARALHAGHVVGFPTETVYGLAVRAEDPAARRRLARLKGRPDGKPFQVLVADRAKALEICPGLPPAALRLAKAFWPGPLTMVVRDARGRWQGLRVPDHALARRLIRKAGGAMVATSANRSGEPPVRTAAELVATFGDGVAAVLDGGPPQSGRASTVVKVGARKWEMIREGAISRREIAAVAGVDNERKSLL